MQGLDSFRSHELALNATSNLDVRRWTAGPSFDAEVHSTACNSRSFFVLAVGQTAEVSVDSEVAEV
jgi:hypothetical protein